MKRTYIIGHWGLTILLAPFISQVIQYIEGTSFYNIIAMLEVYPILIIFSIAFSLPTFLVYLTCFYFLAKQDINSTALKAILITVSVLGIYITQTIIKGSMSEGIIITYSLTSIIVGLILRIKSSNGCLKPQSLQNVQVSATTEAS